MNERTKKLIISFAWAAVIKVLSADGLFRKPELLVEDELFQRPEAVPGDIVIIGIDDRDIDEFGNYNTWDRSIMASALEALASDPDRRPAVVAIDTTYAGSIKDNPEGDKRLSRS